MSEIYRDRLFSALHLYQQGVHGNNERKRYYRVVERSGTIGWPSIGNLSELLMTHAAISVYGIQFEGALEQCNSLLV